MNPQTVRTQALAFLAACVWMRFGLEKGLELTSAFLSGGACFFIDTASANTAPLGDSYSGVVTHGISWGVAVGAAFMTTAPATLLNWWVQRRIVASWVPPVAGLVGVCLGCSPFLACRFPGAMLPAEATLLPWSIVLGSLSSCFLLSWCLIRVLGPRQADVTTVQA